ncbi:MAG TPA: DUF2279 domain-containing protein [Campylobacterales bacterium]|nr:DUF2279 domain-containing protein [Campylobacterales bacterium]
MHFMRYFKKVLIGTFFSLYTLYANESNTTSWSSNFTPTQKLTATNILLTSAVLGWGFSQWGYGEESYHTDNEGWFEKTTNNGGSDKLGHIYTNYVATRALAPLYESWGYEKQEAGLYASFTSLMISGLLIEVGDGYSSHGFSSKDFLSDAVGVGAGYLLYMNPSLAKKVDLRVEYNPFISTDNSTDISTDYERMKHLVTIKANGFKAFEDTPLSYLELHLGYYSRNFNHNHLPIAGRDRNIYIGLGVNLSKLLNPTMGNYSKLFNYIQIPHTYIEQTFTK